MRGPFGRLGAILGAPGLVFALFSLWSFGFGLVILAREYDRLRATGREALHPILAGWVQSVPVHYLRHTLFDYAEAYRRAAPADRPARRAELKEALGLLGSELNPSDGREPLIRVVALDVLATDGTTLASWRPATGPEHGPAELTDRVPLAVEGPESPLELSVRYRVARAVERAARGLESSYRRLLLAVTGLSGYSLLCLGYMILQAGLLRDRAAREAAQRATLDLADRTCHELGNVAFVLTNERRNLTDHLDLIERFVAEEPAALEAAIARARLEPDAADRLRRALRREYAARGIDPAVELHGGAAIARDVCRQIAVCSDYIALTVRELDAYLKQSSLPVVPAPLAVSDCFDDVLALLGPSLEAASASVERPATATDGPRILADRRLLVHALVNLLKNAVEATTAAAIAPRIVLATRAEGATVRIEIRDNGPGIPPDSLARIFEPGFSTKGAGRGRGLAIARESIQAQGGQLDVKSQPGSGTTFRISLPSAP